MPMRPDDSYLEELSRYHQAGANVVILNTGFGTTSLNQHIKVIAFMRHWLLQRPDQYLLISNVNDICIAQKTGKLAVAFNIEGAHIIEDQLSLVQLLYDLGVKWMLLAYNKNNRYAGGCHDNDTGLTAEGYELVHEMNRVGMTVCCSHTGAKSAMDIINYSEQPVIFSHSNAFAVYEHPRNISDEHIKACAKKGGVIGITGVSIFLGSDTASVEGMVRHINHIVQLVGDDHVGIALDYIFDQQELTHALKSTNIFPANQAYDSNITILSPEEYPEITEALLKRNYSESRIRKILGGNFLRIARTVWK